MTKNEIKKICEKYKITNYTINNDMTIDVDGDVDLSFKQLYELPLNFNRVNGFFDCSHNTLNSLKGSPNYVGHYFSCSQNILYSLRYSPSYVNEDFYCIDNRLSSLQYSPEIVKGNFGFNKNNIRTFDYFPDVGKYLLSNYNPIDDLWILFADKKHIDYFNELDIIQKDGKVVILDRLNYFLTDIGKEEISKDYIKNYKVI